jgi:hypothetical protein
MLRWLCLACLAAGVLSSTATAEPGAPSLLQAFPLNPTGERIETVEMVRVQPQAEAADESRTGLAVAAAAGLLLLLASTRLFVRKRHVRRARQFVLDRWEPVRGLPSRERRAVARARHPDIPVRAWARTRELHSRQELAPPPPPGEWLAVGSPESDEPDLVRRGVRGGESQVAPPLRRDR